MNSEIETPRGYNKPRREKTSESIISLYHHGSEKATISGPVKLMGHEMVQFVIQARAQQDSSSLQAETYRCTVHKELLCKYSKYFNRLWSQPRESNLVREITQSVVADHDRIKLDSTQVRDLPDGYVASFVKTAEEWSKEVGDADTTAEEDRGTVQSLYTTQEKYIEYFDGVNSKPVAYEVLFSWLYTQQIPQINGRDLYDHDALVSVYNLARKWEVVRLQRECYNQIYSKCREDLWVPFSSLREPSFDCTDLEELFARTVATILKKGGNAPVQEMLKHRGEFSDMVVDFGRENSHLDKIDLPEHLHPMQRKKDGKYMDDDDTVYLKEIALAEKKKALAKKEKALSKLRNAIDETKNAQAEMENALSELAEKATQKEKVMAEKLEALNEMKNALSKCEEGDESAAEEEDEVVQDLNEDDEMYENESEDGPSSKDGDEDHSEEECPTEIGPGDANEESGEEDMSVDESDDEEVDADDEMDTDEADVEKVDVDKARVDKADVNGADVDEADAGEADDEEADDEEADDAEEADDETDDSDEMEDEEVATDETDSEEIDAAQGLEEDSPGTVVDDGMDVDDEL